MRHNEKITFPSEGDQTDVSWANASSRRICRCEVSRTYHEFRVLPILSTCACDGRIAFSSSYPCFPMLCLSQNPIKVPLLRARGNMSAIVELSFWGMVFESVVLQPDVEPGDVVIVIQVKPHDVFEREGDDLIAKK